MKTCNDIGISRLKNKNNEIAADPLQGRSPREEGLTAVVADFNTLVKTG
jgi:hypothetical protein